MTITRSRDRLKLPKQSHTSQGLVDVEDSNDSEEKEGVDVVLVSKKLTSMRKKAKEDVVEKRTVIMEKLTKATKREQQEVKSFYGFKCYLDQLIDEVNRVGSLMDAKTIKVLMETPFSGFFSAILEGKITKDIVQRCTKSITSIIPMYTGDGLGFKFSEKGEAAQLRVADVACILGIRMGEESFDTHEKVLGKCGVFEIRYFKVQRISRRGLGDEMSKLLGKKKLIDEERLDVVRMLILYSFATFFFANTSGSVAKAIVKKFDDMPYVNKCCWSSMIHQHLMQSIQKHHKSNEPNYFFLEHTTVHKPIKGREMSAPRMTKWNLKQVTGTHWEYTLDKLSEQEYYSMGERRLCRKAISNRSTSGGLVHGGYDINRST